VTIRLRLTNTLNFRCPSAALPGYFACLALVAFSVSGCGGRTVATSGVAPPKRKVVAPLPAYRVGQYCLPSEETKYRAAGLACGHHHLAKR
jgi:hypothetical protein